MAVIGNLPATDFKAIKKQSITGDGDSAYTLDYSVTHANDLEVFVNNVRQEPTLAYSASEQTLTMSEGVDSTDDFYVIYKAQTFGNAVPNQNTITTGMMTDASITSKKLHDSQESLTLSHGIVVNGANLQALIKNTSGSGIARLNIQSSTNDGYQHAGIGLGTGDSDVELMYTNAGNFDINLENNVALRLDGEANVLLTSKNQYTTNGKEPGKIIGMHQANVLTWEGLHSSWTTPGTQIPSPTTNKYNVSFTVNGGGSTNRNRWYLEDDWSGNRMPVWRGVSNDAANSGGQGGWDTSTFYVDDNYAYLYVNFVKRVSSVATGTYYFGCAGGNVNYNNGTSEGNPYFSIISTSSLVKDEWYLDYHTVQSQNDGHNTGIHNNGLYRMSNGTRLQAGVQGASDLAYKLQGNGYQTHRTYLYYATANDGTSLSFGQPMVFKCDGTQPPLSHFFKLFEAAA